MNPNSDAIDQLRRLSTADLTHLGEESLQSRLLEQAIFAHAKYGPLAPANLHQLLNDRQCTRYPTRLAFELGDMASHQFAQPGPDSCSPDDNNRVLHLHPGLQNYPDLVPLAVAYMLPVLNYGHIVRDEHCLAYGATLLGLLESEFYSLICALADTLGATSLLRNSNS